MGVIVFREDIDQNAAIENLNQIKVNLATYNTAMNDISNRFTTLRNDLETADAGIKDYADNLVAALRDGAVQDNTTAIALLNGDKDTKGSVDNKISTAINAIVNGAPEAYDTLQELLDLIKNEDAGLTDLIDQVNGKVAALVGGASENWNTLEKIEVATKQIKSDLEAAIEAANDGVSDAVALIPHYKYDHGLAITTDDDGVNRVVLSNVPVDDIIGGKATVYTEDDFKNITIESMFTISKSTADDATAKDYVIEADIPLNMFKASIEYFYNNKDNS